MSNEAQKLKKKLDRLTGQLNMYEKILMGDTKGVMSSEEIKKKIKENNTFCDNISTTLSSYFKVKDDAMIGDQITYRAKKIKKAINGTEEQINDYKQMIKSADKKIVKLQKISLDDASNFQNNLHKFSSLVSKSNSEFKETLKTEKFRFPMKKDVKKAFVKCYSSKEDAHDAQIRKLKQTLKALKKPQRNPEDEFTEAANDYRKKIIKNIKKFPVTYNESLDNLEKRINKVGKKANKLIEKMKPKDRNECDEDNEKMKQTMKNEYKQTRKQIEEKQEAEKEEIINKIRAELGNTESEESQKKVEDEKKKRYLLALQHLQKHKEEYPQEEEEIPLYPGQEK